ncbi:MAG: hypothetical protein ISR69_10575 [Gammaproteobacteria bacterium]|nr:hypothetical protein [Gammaproteobacteria bacterium]
MKLKILLLTALLISFLWLDWLDKYDSYGECIYEYKFNKDFAESVCPGCNDWKKEDEKAVLRCLDYLKPWE